MQTVTFGRRASAPGSAPTRAWAPAAPVKPAPIWSTPSEAVEMPKAAPTAARRTKTPRVTFGLIAGLALIFVLELALSGAAGHPGRPSHAVLFRLGGVSRQLVMEEGQVWRLLTAPLLHANMGHIVGNAVALLFAGLMLEPMIGRRWFGAVYLVGGVGGCLGSIFLNAHSVLGVGASGAIMALLACTLVLSFHIACYDRRIRMRMLSLRVGVPALLPLSGAAGHIDYSAHMGGAIAGVVMDFVLQAIWPENEDRPPLRPYAGSLAISFGLISAAALAAVALLPASLLAERITPGLALPDELPQTSAEIRNGVDGLLARYPQDPRVHGLAAAAYIQAKDEVDAAVELEKGLASPLLAAPEVPATLAGSMRMTLVGLYVKARRLDDARQAAEPLCREPVTPERERFVGLIRKAHFCDGPS